MGLRNPRVHCPKCNGLIHTQKTFFSGTQTGTTCELCGVALTGKLNWKGRAELADPAKPEASPTPKSPAPSGNSFADEVAKLVQLRKAGELTSEEFQEAKNRLREASIAENR